MISQKFKTWLTAWMHALNSKNTVFLINFYYNNLKIENNLSKYTIVD